MNPNGTSTNERESIYLAVVGNSTTGGAKAAVTDLANGSFAGQFEQLEGEDVVLGSSCREGIEWLSWGVTVTVLKKRASDSV